MATFHVPAGTPGLIRRKGDADWRHWTADRDRVFRRCTLTDNGRLWQFRAGGCLMKVLPHLVRREGAERRQCPAARQRGTKQNAGERPATRPAYLLRV